MSKINAIVMNNADNVATVTKNIHSGEEIFFQAAGGEVTVHAIDAVRSGHKVAIKNIDKGGKIIKYGEVIGKATVPVAAGQHVHIHNLEGCRGRGDLNS